MRGKALTRRLDRLPCLAGAERATWLALPLRITGGVEIDSLDIDFLDDGACIMIESRATAHRFALLLRQRSESMDGNEMTCHTSRAEVERMAAVRRYDILDTPPDGAFDRITRIASRLFAVPIAIVSIVDHDRIWFKSHHGLDVDEIPRSPGLCASAIMNNEPWVLTDAKLDPRSLANPLVAGDFGLRFYVGVPLRTFDGYNLGTLCVIDKEPRDIRDDEVAHLQDLAAVVMDEIELRRAAHKAVEEKEVLFREVHHRVKNNMQIVSSLLSLTSRQMPPEARSRVDECLLRIQSMASLHEKFYKGRQVEVIDLVAYLSEMAQTIIRSYGLEERVRATVLGEAVEVDLERGTAFALLAAEVIANACKHAFPEDREGKIEIELRERDGKLRFAVADDGVGMAASAAEKGEGIGQKLIANFVQRLEGTSSFFGSQGGTKFQMTCPINALTSQ